MRTKKQRSPLRVALIVFLLAVIGLCLYNILPPYLERMQAEQDYRDLAENYVSVKGESGSDEESNVSEAKVEAVGEDAETGETDAESADAEQETKEAKKDWWSTDVVIAFDELREINEDIIGWIRFDNCDVVSVNYPILYSGDNTTYLRTDIYGNYHTSGCIFLEGLNAPDFSDLYNIIYGHNMNSSAMFGVLKNYQKEDFWRENQYFTIYTESMAYRYQIFSCYAAKNGGDVYRVGFEADQVYEEFISQMVEASLYDTGVWPERTQQILTLSTCTGDGNSKRFVVHAVCVDAQTTDTTELE